MTLYWPIWVCYLLYGMVKVPGQLWSRLQQQTDMTAYARDYALYNSLRLEVDVAAIAIMAVVCGMALFGYLFTQKNAYMIHALPVTRGELYVTNMISGLCFLLIPQALVFLVTVVLCLLKGIASVQFLGLWFLSVMGIAFSFMQRCVFVSCLPDSCLHFRCTFWQLIMWHLHFPAVHVMSSDIWDMDLAWILCRNF